MDYSKIEVTSSVKIQQILEFEIITEFNEHTELKLKGIINEETNYQGAIKSTFEDTIEICTKDENKTTLFKGNIIETTVSIDCGTYYIEVRAISGSFKMDLKKKSRSFQNKDMLYTDLLETITNEYAGGDCINTVGENEKLERPIIQYEETDWEFLKRIASHFSTVLLPDTTDNKPRFWMGIPQGREKEIKTFVSYKVEKDYYGYNKVKNIEEGLDTNDFLNYYVNSYEDYHIGDNVSFKNKHFIISSKKIIIENGLVLFEYRLAFKKKMLQNKKYNPKLTGISLKGKILEVKGEQAKIHLDIDKKQSKEDAYFFLVNTLTGNLMYCMPEVGTEANLHIQGEGASTGEITVSVRSNGEQCPKTIDPNKRYFQTAKGKELSLEPGNVSLTAKESEGETLKLKIDDEEGVHITSHKTLNLSGKDEVQIKSEGSVILSGHSTIMLQRGTNGKGISLENEINLVNAQTIQLEGRDRATFTAFDDAPKPGQEKKAFSWGNLFKAVVAAVAVVAVVAVGAMSFGVGGLALGCVIAATSVTVGTVAVNDIRQNEFSGLSAYIKAGAKAAVTTAMFGPFKGLGLLLFEKVDPEAIFTVINYGFSIFMVIGKGMDPNSFKYKKLKAVAIRVEALGSTAVNFYKWRTQLIGLITNTSYDALASIVIPNEKNCNQFADDMDMIMSIPGSILQDIKTTADLKKLENFMTNSDLSLHEATEYLQCVVNTLMLLEPKGKNGGNTPKVKEVVKSAKQLAEEATRRTRNGVGGLFNPPELVFANGLIKGVFDDVANKVDDGLPQTEVQKNYNKVMAEMEAKRSSGEGKTSEGAPNNKVEKQSIPNIENMDKVEAARYQEAWYNVLAEELAETRKAGKHFMWKQRELTELDQNAIIDRAYEKGLISKKTSKKSNNKNKRKTEVELTPEEKILANIKESERAREVSKFGNPKKTPKRKMTREEWEAKDRKRRLKKSYKEDPYSCNNRSMTNDKKIGSDSVIDKSIDESVNYKSFKATEFKDTVFKSDIYKPVEIEGNIKIDGIEQNLDISRKMYQRNDIDWNLKDKDGRINAERAKAGEAPIGSDGYAIELHHLLQSEPGAMVEVLRTSHRGPGNMKILHGLRQGGQSFRNNPILDKQYNKFQSEYWKWRISQIKN